jgi:hypothetical protein
MLMEAIKPGTRKGANGDDQIPGGRPTGSGHWLIVIAPPPRQVAVNDPWGEPDLMHGTFAASEAVRCWEPSRGPTEMVMDEKKENEHQENLAFSDNDTIDFEQLRRDLTPDQRLQLVVILLQL